MKNKHLSNFCHPERSRGIFSPQLRDPSTLVGMTQDCNSQFNQRGQALITLLFFSMIALTVTMGAVGIMYSNALGATRFQRGAEAYEVAQSGAENAILRLLRNPAYTGETLAVGNGDAVIQVTNNGGGSYTILSTGTVGNSLRRIQVDGTYTNNQFVESSRREVY